MIVFTAGQTTSFFEIANQMALPNGTVIQLATEGLTSVDNLSEFHDDSWKQVADNLCRSTGREPDPQPSAAAGATIPMQPFVFGAKSQQRLRAASDLVQYYEVVGRNLTAPNMQWDPVVKT